jgi:hypothetical protein
MISIGERQYSTNQPEKFLAIASEDNIDILNGLRVTIRNWKNQVQPFFSSLLVRPSPVFLLWIGGTLDACVIF